MYITTQKNLLPTTFTKINKNNIPITLIISQLIITSITLIILTNTNNNNNISFLITLTLTIIIYLYTYFILFINYIILILKHPNLKHTFNIPNNKKIKLIITIINLLTSIITFIISFLPPNNIQNNSTNIYIKLLIINFLIILTLPFILYTIHNHKNKTNTNITLKPINNQNTPKNHFFLHPHTHSPHYIIINNKKH